MRFAPVNHTYDSQGMADELIKDVMTILGLDNMELIIGDGERAATFVSIINFDIRWNLPMNCM